MKKFTLTASDVFSTTCALDKATSKEIGDALAGKLDVIEANRFVSRVVNRCKEANTLFHTEVMATEEKNMKLHQDFRDKVEDGELDVETPELQKEWADIKKMFKKNDKASRAKEYGPNEIGVVLSDEDLELLKFFLPSTAAHWVGPNNESCRDLFVRFADVIDAAQEAV
jgi:hypothetical protein